MSIRAFTLQRLNQARAQFPHIVAFGRDVLAFAARRNARLWLGLLPLTALVYWAAPMPLAGSDQEALRQTTLRAGSWFTFAWAGYIALTQKSRLDFNWLQAGILQRLCMTFLAAVFVSSGYAQSLVAGLAAHGAVEVAQASLMMAILVGMHWAGAPHPLRAGPDALGRLVLKNVPRSEQDIRATAIHEAGHVMMLACLSRIPSSVEVEVAHTYCEESRLKGCVRGVPTPSEVTPEYLQWRMLLLLGGTQAERVATGARTVGCASDLTQWQAAARMWLANGFGPDLPVPTAQATEAELEHNRQLMRELRVQQTQVLERFFERNRSTFDTLVQELQASGVLNASRLAKLLAPVVITEGLPRRVRLEA